MNPKDNETSVTFNFFQYFYFLIGLRKAKFDKTNAKSTGRLYKTYASLILLTITIVTIYYINDTNTRSKVLFEHAMVVRCINFLNYITVILSMVVLSISSIYRDPQIICRMYKSLWEIDEFLGFYASRNRSNVKLELFLHYLFFFVFKVGYMYVLAMCWPEYNTLFYHMPMLIIDSEIIRFIIETNLVSKKIRDFNKQLGALKLKKDIGRRIDSMKTMKNKNVLYEFFCVHEKICTIVDIINSCYGFKVFIKYIDKLCFFSD